MFGSCVCFLWGIQSTADLFCFDLSWLMVRVNVQEPAWTKLQKKEAKTKIVSQLVLSQRSRNCLLTLTMSNTSTYETPGVAKAIRFQTVRAAADCHTLISATAEVKELNPEPCSHSLHPFAAFSSYGLGGPCARTSGSLVGSLRGFLLVCFMPLVGEGTALCRLRASASFSTPGDIISPPQQRPPHPARREVREHSVPCAPEQSEEM